MDEKQEYELLDVSARKTFMASGKEADLIHRVIEYRNQSVDFLKDSHDSTVLSAASEEMREGFIRQQKRLRKRELQIEIEEEDVQLFPHLNMGGLAQLCDFATDGEYTIGCFRKRMKRTTKYRRNHDEAATFVDLPWMHYYTREKEGEAGQLSSVDVLYESSLCGRNTEYLPFPVLEKKKVSIIALAVLMTLLWMACGICAIFFYALTMANRDWGVLLAFLALGVGKVALDVTKLHGRCSGSYHYRLRSRKMIELIRKEKPEFCVDRLVSLIDDKLNHIIYAEDKEELVSFTEGSLGNFRRDHENVVNVERMNFWIDKCKKEDGCLYLQVTERLWVTRDDRNAITREREDVQLQLMKPVDGIMSEDFYEDWCIISAEVTKDLVYEYEYEG